MAILSTDLVRYRLELASRGEPPWADMLADVETAFGDLEPPRDGEFLRDFLRRWTPAQRLGYRRFFHDLGHRSSDRDLHGPECECLACDPWGERSAAKRAALNGKQGEERVRREWLAALDRIRRSVRRMHAAEEPEPPAPETSQPDNVVRVHFGGIPGLYDR